MSVYAISDLHLSFGSNKPMDIFGQNWENHFEKIKKDWINEVKEEDLVILAGDFSWAIDIKDTYEDFEYLNKLPGKKLLLKGNHDYWWTTLTKMNKYLENNNFKNINFIQNNSYLYKDNIIVGSRGWTKEETDESNKIIVREKLRLEMSIKNGIEKYGNDKEIIAVMHFPPFEKNNENQNINSSYINIFKKYKIKKCIYGHIHGKNGIYKTIESIENIQFILTSCDQVGFKLVKIV